MTETRMISVETWLARHALKRGGLEYDPRILLVWEGKRFPFVKRIQIVDGKIDADTPVPEYFPHPNLYKPVPVEWDRRYWTRDQEVDWILKLMKERGIDLSHLRLELMDAKVKLSQLTEGRM